MNRSDSIKLIDEFLDNLYDIGYNNKMFYSRPIAESREDAVMDSNVEKFLTNSYDASGEEDEEFLEHFTNRLFNRFMEL